MLLICHSGGTQETDTNDPHAGDSRGTCRIQTQAGHTGKPKHKFHRRGPSLHEGGRETRARPHTSRFQQGLTERDAATGVPPAPHTTRAACRCPPVGLAPPLGYEPSRPPHQIGYRAFGFWELLAGRGSVPRRKMVHAALAG